MAGNITLTMLKPDAVAAGHSGKIIDLIIQSGFKIQAMKLSRLSKEKAEEFYAIHKERGFFNDLIKFMTEGPIIAAVLEKDNAVEDFRKLIGATNPANAADGTIRKLYATDIERNAVHGSDSDENAAIEASFHFSGLERY
jgi:nucleoside-diphosphate kinase